MGEGSQDRHGGEAGEMPTTEAQGSVDSRMENSATEESPGKEERGKRWGAREGGRGGSGVGAQGREGAQVGSPQKDRLK